MLHSKQGKSEQETTGLKRERYVEEVQESLIPDRRIARRLQQSAGLPHLDLAPTRDRWHTNASVITTWLILQREGQDFQTLLAGWLAKLSLDLAVSAALKRSGCKNFQWFAIYALHRAPTRDKQELAKSSEVNSISFAVCMKAYLH